MKYLLLPILGLTSIAAAHAQNVAGSEDNSIVLADRKIDPTEITVLATGFRQNRNQSGQAISVITSQRLDDLQSVTVADALRTLPGVAVAQRGPTGSQTSVFLRGGNSSQTLVLIDGVRVNDPSSPNAAFDFGNLLTGNSESIELLRGPNSIIWGSQAIGGVVNIQSAEPTDQLNVKAGLEGGYANTFSGHANLAGKAGIAEISLGGSLYRTDGISALSGGTERDGSRIYALNGKVKLNLSDDLSLDLRSYYSNNRVDFDSPFGGGANALPVARNRQFTLYAGANFTAADGRFQNRLAYTRTKIDRLGTDPVVFSFNNYVVAGKIDRFEYRGSFDLSDLITITAGAEHENIYASTSFEGAPADVARNQVSSGYAQLTLHPLSGLTVTGGLRHDAYTDYGAHTLFSGNLAWALNNGTTVLRASYAEGFRAPTLTEGQPPFGNKNLKPETARNFDLGVEQHFLDGKAHASATWFHRRSTNLIAFSFVTFQSENIDKVDIDGLELALAANATDTLQIEANYTLTNAYNRAGANTGKRLQLRPQNSGSLSVDWRSPIKLKLGGTLTYAGESFDNASNTVKLKSYALLGLRAAYPITEKIELYGRVDNLFDKQYTTVAGYSTYGRSAYAGVRAKF